MLSLLLKLLGSSLELWADKEKHKYQDRYLALKKAYYEEQNKDPARRSDAVLDNIEFELRILVDSFCASSGKPVA